MGRLKVEMKELPVNTIIQGDCIEVMQSLPEQCVHCVVSSPPYWGLRDYSIPGRQWSNGWFGSHGLEPTLDMYVQNEVEVLRAIRRVLRDDGVVFWNLGDSYAGSGSPGGDFRDGKGGDDYLRPYNRDSAGLKPLDKCGVPERVALALQADGWYWRDTIICGLKARASTPTDPAASRPTASTGYDGKDIGLK